MTRHVLCTRITGGEIRESNASTVKAGEKKSLPTPFQVYSIPRVRTGDYGPSSLGGGRTRNVSIQHGQNQAIIARIRHTLQVELTSHITFQHSSTSSITNVHHRGRCRNDETKKKGTSTITTLWFCQDVGRHSHFRIRYEFNPCR